MGQTFTAGRFKSGRRTVQGELTQALSLIDGRSVNVHGSGRTDAGVHAEGQVASVEIQREITTTKLRAAINGNIGRDVRVLRCGNRSRRIFTRAIRHSRRLTFTGS